MKGEFALFHDLGTNYLSNLTAGTFWAPSSEQSRAEQVLFQDNRKCDSNDWRRLIPRTRGLNHDTPMCVCARTPAAPCEGQAADKLFSLKFEHQQELRWQHLGGRRVRSEEGEEGEETPLGQRVTVGGESLLTPALWRTDCLVHLQLVEQPLENNMLLFFFCFRTK